MKQPTLLFLFLISLSIHAQSSKDSVEPFLENIVSQFPNVRDLALSPKQDEAIFSAQSFMSDLSALMSIKKENGKWSTPKITSFSGQYFDIEPFFSNDGLTLYFASNRPLDNTTTETKDFDIWYVTRTGLNDEWSKPINLGAPVNTKMDEFYPVITDSKNIYFTLDNPELKQKDDIYVSEYSNGSYTTPKLLGAGINSEGYEFNAFVSPDESYIIYTCYNRKDGLGSGDLYLSFKQENGEWSPSKNMGELVNSNKMDYCPYVDPATNTLYLTSKRNHTKTKNETSLTTEAFTQELFKYQNGLSRLYKASIEEFLQKQ